MQSKEWSRARSKSRSSTSSGLGPKSGPGIFQLSQPSQILCTRVLLLIRALDIDMSEGLKLYCCNFFYQTPIL